MIWGGADVIIIEIKCTINVMHLNHPQTTPPHSSLLRNYLPQNWYLCWKCWGPLLQRIVKLNNLLSLYTLIIEILKNSFCRELWKMLRFAYGYEEMAICLLFQDNIYCTNYFIRYFKKYMISLYTSSLLMRGKQSSWNPWISVPLVNC